ncbi:MAG: archease [Thiobacillaceae bacterium]
MENGSFDYFAHEADMGIIGRGPTLANAFESAASAMFAIMAEPAKVQHQISVQFEFEDADPEFALVTMLNRLLAEARIRRAIFSKFNVVQNGLLWKVEARGEPWREELERGTEVKGATLTMLSVRHSESGWEARCVVDV